MAAFVFANQKVVWAGDERRSPIWPAASSQCFQSLSSSRQLSLQLSALTPLLPRRRSTVRLPKASILGPCWPRELVISVSSVSVESAAMYPSPSDWTKRDIADAVMRAGIQIRAERGVNAIHQRRQSYREAQFN